MIAEYNGLVYNAEIINDKVKLSTNNQDKGLSNNKETIDITDKNLTSIYNIDYYAKKDDNTTQVLNNNIEKMIFKDYDDFIIKKTFLIKNYGNKDNLMEEISVPLNMFLLSFNLNKKENL